MFHVEFKRIMEMCRLEVNNMVRAKPRSYYRKPAGLPRGYITVGEAMRRAKCAEITIRRQIANRRFRCVRWRDRVLLREADVTEWNRIRLYRRKPRAAEPATPPAATIRAQHGADRVSEAKTASLMMPSVVQPHTPASAEVQP